MLRDDINNAVKEAMKAKDERKLGTLRMVNATIKNADIEARGNGKPPDPVANFGYQAQGLAVTFQNRCTNATDGWGRPPEPPEPPGRALGVATVVDVVEVVELDVLEDVDVLVLDEVVVDVVDVDATTELRTPASVHPHSTTTAQASSRRRGARRSRRPGGEASPVTAG